jgi:Mn2+/Fe2+ NRAMP family transporter
MSGRPAWWRTLGPGLAVAATGVGAGDLMAALIAGAEHGTPLLWVIVLGAGLKLALTEALARWQLATGTPLLEGWFRHLGPVLRVYFTGYLLVWGYVVAAGLMTACGVAAHALLPAVPIAGWAVLHSVAAALLVLTGRYALFETTMKVLVGLMVVTLPGSVALLGVDAGAALRGLLVPVLPPGSAPSALALMGGVGGSVTLLSYGYWIAERRWRGTAHLTRVRIDLAVGYLLTAGFGVAMLMLAAAVLGGGAGLPGGSRGLVACADAIAAAAASRSGEAAGATLRTVFLVGIWAAVATSTLGVWQGVPYLFADTARAWRGRFAGAVSTRSALYRAGLAFLAVPPMLLLALDRPVWVIRLYTVTGALFMPLLAGSLLWLGRRRWLGAAGNGWLARLMLALAVLVFLAILGRQVADL